MIFWLRTEILSDNKVIEIIRTLDRLLANVENPN